MIWTGVSFVNFIKYAGIALVLHKAEVEIAHQQGGGEPAQGQKHSKDEAFHQDAHIYYKGDIVSFIE